MHQPPSENPPAGGEKEIESTPEIAPPSQVITPVSLTSENPLLPSDNVPKGKVRKEARDRNYTIWFILLLVCLAIVFAIFFFFMRNKKPAKEAQQATQSATTQTETPKEETKQIAYVNSDVGLNLRSEASTTGAILQTLPNGTEINILSDQGDWYFVDATSKGYVAKQYVTTTKPAVVLKVYDASSLNLKFIYPETYKVSLTKGNITAFSFTSSGDSSGGFSIAKEASGTPLESFMKDKYASAVVKDCDITIGNTDECKMLTVDNGDPFYLAVSSGTIYKFTVATNYGNFPADLTATIFPSFFFAK